MKFPIDKHGISIGNSRFKILARDVIDAKNGANYSDEIDEVCKRGEDWGLVFEITRVIFRKISRSRNTLERIRIFHYTSERGKRKEIDPTYSTFVFVIFTW